MPIYQKPNIQQWAGWNGSQDLPLFCLRGFARDDRPNKFAVRADITYLPDAAWAFFILFAISLPYTDYAQHDPDKGWTGTTRKVLAWRISNTLEAEFSVLMPLNEASQVRPTRDL